MGVDARAGKKSVTRFKVTRRLDRCTLLEAFPVTGRRHQVRVHLYSIGHPIVGDRRYGDRHLQERFPRLMLHARSLRIGLPSGKTVIVESPIPAAFSERGLRALLS
jgi:23S rRNA-/tRNA-specific pseudouridylate synthase